jgi:hypothetical protein
MCESRRPHEPGVRPLFRSTPICDVWLFGLYGEAESREQFGLCGETHTGLSTENIGLFGDHRWTLSVHLQQAILVLSIC